MKSKLWRSVSYLLTYVQEHTLDFLSMQICCLFTSSVVVTAQSALLLWVSVCVVVLVLACMCVANFIFIFYLVQGCVRYGALFASCRKRAAEIMKLWMRACVYVWSRRQLAEKLFNLFSILLWLESKFVFFAYFRFFDIKCRFAVMQLNKSGS